MAQAEILPRKLSGHQDEISALAFHPDGKTLVSSSYDKTIRFWDWESGQETGRIEGEHRFYGLALSPAGNRLLASEWVFPPGDILSQPGPLDLQNQVVRLFELPGKTSLWQAVLEKSTARRLAFSPNGTTCFAGSEDGTIWEWAIDTGRLTRKLAPFCGFLRTLAFSPDGEFGVMASLTGPVVIWETGSGAEVHRFTDHKNGVFACDFSPMAKPSVRLPAAPKTSNFCIGIGKTARKPSNVI